MFPGAVSDGALSAIHAAFASPVLFRRKSDGVETLNLPAVFSDLVEEYASDFGRTNRRVIFEIRQSALPRQPVQGDQIDNGTIWRVIQSVRRDDVGAWECHVERAGGADA